MDEGKRARGESNDRQAGWDESDETRGVVKRRRREIDTMNRNTTIAH